MKAPAITHARKIRPILPERRHITLLETLAQRSDALGGELSAEALVSIIAQTAELVVVQAARNKQ